MENTGYVTAGELALWGNRGMYNNECGYGYRDRNRGLAATAVALGASGLGIAVFGGLAIAYGLNAASKARARGNENAIAQQSKTMELLAGVVNREATRADGISIDVNQNLRSLASQTATALAQGGSSTSSALATAEALALLNNSNGTNPLSSVIQQNCALRVQRVSEQNCGCCG